VHLRVFGIRVVLLPTKPRNLDDQFCATLADSL